MCLIILNTGNTLPEEYLYNAASANPDGAGLAYYDGIKHRILKFFYLDNLITHYNEIAKNHRPILLHFRLASQGKINYSNTQPLQLANGAILAHNGHIDGMGDKKTSDTYILAQILGKLSISELFTHGKQLLEAISQLSFSKFVLMYQDQVEVIGEFYEDPIYGMFSNFSAHYAKHRIPWYDDESWLLEEDDLAYYYLNEYRKPLTKKEKKHGT